jgi:hypothetical protein
LSCSFEIEDGDDNQNDMGKKSPSEVGVVPPVAVISTMPPPESRQLESSTACIELESFTGVSDPVSSCVVDSVVDNIRNSLQADPHTTEADASSAAESYAEKVGSGAEHFSKRVEESSEAESVAGKVEDSSEAEPVSKEVGESLKAESVAEKVEESSKAESVAQKVEDSSKVESVAEKIQDSSKVDSVAEKVEDSSKAESVAKNIEDSSKVESVAEKVEDSSKAESVVEKVEDSSKPESVAEKVEDSSKAKSVLEKIEESSEAEPNKKNPLEPEKRICDIKECSSLEPGISSTPAGSNPQSSKENEPMTRSNSSSQKPSKHAPNFQKKFQHFQSPVMTSASGLTYSSPIRLTSEQIMQFYGSSSVPTPNATASSNTTGVGGLRNAQKLSTANGKFSWVYCKFMLHQIKQLKRGVWLNRRLSFNKQRFQLFHQPLRISQVCPIF